jgi:hypothetical protein
LRGCIPSLAAQRLASYQTFFRLFQHTLRETISIKRTGAPGNCEQRFLPKLYSIATAMALPMFRNIGEEVICYAVKK